MVALAFNYTSIILSCALTQVNECEHARSSFSEILNTRNGAWLHEADFDPWPSERWREMIICILGGLCWICKLEWESEVYWNSNWNLDWRFCICTRETGEDSWSWSSDHGLSSPRRVLVAYPFRERGISFEVAFYFWKALEVASWAILNHQLLVEQWWFMQGCITHVPIV